MKPLAIWLAAVAVAFGALTAATVLTRSTERVFVVVDSSYPMRAVWADVPAELRSIGDRDRAEFALATEKSMVHDYGGDLSLAGVDPFAPCDLSSIDGYPAAAEADERILVTTPASCPTDALVGWTVVELRP